MSTRCKACNLMLSKFDVTVMKSDTLQEPEDLCSYCRDISYNDENLDTREYQHEFITENWINFNVYNENA